MAWARAEFWRWRTRARACVCVWTPTGALPRDCPWTSPSFLCVLRSHSSMQIHNDSEEREANSTWNILRDEVKR